MGALVSNSDNLLTELTWQVLIEGLFNFNFVGAPIDF